MKNRSAFVLPMLLSALLLGGAAPAHAHAPGEASALSAMSALPVASVVVGAGLAASAVVAVPVALSSAGAALPAASAAGAGVRAGLACRSTYTALNTAVVIHCLKGVLVQ